MKVVVENKIPFITGVLDPVAEVVYLAPEDITQAAVADANALIVRTRTRCDAALLDGSAVKWIGTATIGTDHIDLDYCRRRGIEVANAPGCNAPAVAQYVFAALNHLMPEGLAGRRIGIVGVGNVGSIVARQAERAGMEVLLCDPPRERREGGDRFVSLDEIARRADVITIHVPLSHDGPDATFHLADSDFYARCLHHPVIINAARGPVIDTAATVEALDGRLIAAAVIDCWENEPTIDRQLLDRVAIATPHVAGYSLQGKQRATAMIVDAFAAAHGIDPARLGPLPFDRPTAPADVILSPADIALYDIAADDRALRRDPDSFEALRNNYKYRSEQQPFNPSPK
ncbi:MAG: 4-phosphoerythronate dehydrogenase [Muribaculaceae bacterium]|nr:4-phosphoerythronate dehydrogenase [Muribaculaceae bacterium]